MRIHRRFTIKCFCSLALLCWFSVSPGCKKTSETADHSESQKSAQRDSGFEILQKTVAKYESARSYQDEAVLKLEYRLRGKWVEEYHPQSVVFERDEKDLVQFSCKLFHARIRQDKNRMTCFVFDLPTGNLDDQVWIQPVSHSRRETWGKLLGDPIARHFISGRSEIPVRERKDSPIPMIYPFTLGLLQGFGNPDGFKDSKSVELVSQDDTSFDQLKVKDGDHTHLIWVDKKSGLISRVQLDNRVLTEALQKSPAVTDLKLVVEFRNAKLNESIPSNQFSTQLAKRARPVTQFVKIPEPFPSKLIGYQLPEFSLESDSSAKIESSMLNGGTSTLMMVDATMFHAGDVQKFLALAKKVWSPSTRLTVVLCGEKQVALSTAKQWEKKTKRVNFLFAPQYGICKTLKIEQLPSVVVFDKHLMVHYFKKVGHEPWEADLAAAVQRINNGDDVATEMRHEYEDFLEEYHRKLVQLNPIQKPDSHTSLVSQTIKSKTVRQTTLWSTELKSPGRFCIDRTENSEFYVLEGFRSVAKVSSTGKILKQYTLELPQGVAVTEIQLFKNSSGNRWFVVYSKGGKQVFVFDDHWKKLLTFPSKASSSSTHQIRGVILADLDRDDRGEMYVNVSGSVEQRGLFRIELESGNQHAVFSKSAIERIGLTSILAGKKSCRLLCVTTDRNAIILNEELIPQKTFSLDGLNVKFLCVRKQSSTSCLLVTGNGQSSLIGFRTQPKPTWKSQLPETHGKSPVVSVLPLDFNNRSMWLIADTSGMVSLVQEDQIVDHFQFAATGQDKVKDIQSVQKDGRSLLLVSAGNSLSTVQLDLRKTGESDPE